MAFAVPVTGAVVAHVPHRQACTIVAADRRPNFTFIVSPLSLGLLVSLLRECRGKVLRPEVLVHLSLLELDQGSNPSPPTSFVPVQQVCSDDKIQVLDCSHTWRGPRV